MSAANAESFRPVPERMLGLVSQVAKMLRVPTESLIDVLEGTIHDPALLTLYSGLCSLSNHSKEMLNLLPRNLRKSPNQKTKKQSPRNEKC